MKMPPLTPLAALELLKRDEFSAGFEMSGWHFELDDGFSPAPVARLVGDCLGDAGWWVDGEPESPVTAESVWVAC